MKQLCSDEHSERVIQDVEGKRVTSAAHFPKVKVNPWRIA